LARLALFSLCAVVYVVLAFAGAANKLALEMRLSDKKLKDYEVLWRRVVEWMEQKGEVFLTQSLFNEFLAVRCCGEKSDWMARNARASVCWVCQMFGCLSPVDKITYKLVEGKTRQSKVGGAVTLSWDQVQRVLGAVDCKAKWVLVLGLSLALRPGEVQAGTLSGFKDRGVFRAVFSKWAEVGSDVELCGWAEEAKVKLAQWAVGDEWFYPVKGSLLTAFKVMVTDDPEKLPNLKLKMLRRWGCSNLWALGVSSAWLMAFMHHVHWETTKGYIVSPSLVKWRDAPEVVDGGSKWLPPSALSAPVVQQGGGLGRFVNSQRRRDYIRVRDKCRGLSEDEWSEDGGL